MDEFKIGNPIEFFELGDSFTKKDLKRAYTKKIKQYKPEKFPEEFKQIRKAYEELESRLDYNQNMDFSSFISLDIEEPAEAEENTPESVNIEEVSSAGLHAQFEGKSKEEILSELKAKGDKSLKESVLILYLEYDNDADKYFTELIKLIKENPESYFLLALFDKVKEYSISETVLAEGLISLSSSFKDYLYRTEKLWHTYLTEFGFEKFKELEEKCFESLPVEEELDNYIFYTRLLRKYFFRLPSSYIEEKISIIENVSMDKRDSLEIYLYYLELLNNYSSVKDQVIQGEKWQGLHEIILAYTEQNILKAEELFYEYAYNMDSDFINSQVAYDDEAWQPVSNLLDYVSVDILSFRDDTQESIDENILKHELKKFTSRLETRLDPMSKFKHGLLNFASGYTYFITFMFCFIISKFVWAHEDWMVNAAFWVVWLALALLVLTPKIISPLNDKIYESFHLKYYKNIYRKQVIELLLSIPLEQSDFIDHMVTVDEVTDLSCPAYIAYFGREDAALRLASIFGRID